MARGLGNSYGVRKESDINRSVTRRSMHQALASRLHYDQQKTAREVRGMSPDDWESLSGGNAEQEEVAQYLRAYEHYQ